MSDYKICPVCFGNGEIRKGERNPLEVIAEQKELLDKMANTVDIIMQQNDTIRLLRENGERLAEALKDELKNLTGVNLNKSYYALDDHNDLLKQLDEQEALK
jgi:hypothetical protein